MLRLSVSIFVSIVAGAAGQLMMKLGTQQLPALKELLTLQVTWLTTAELMSLVWLVAGIICYLLAMLVWLRVLRDLPLNVAYPLLSLGYVVVYLGAYFLPTLSETLTIQSTLGIVLIIVGVIVIASKPKGASYES